MDWAWFSTPLGLAIIAPAGAFVGALLGVGISSWTARSTHRERLRADRELAERKADADVALAERKFALDQQHLLQNRRSELAETILAEAYRFRDLMTFVRNGFAFGDDGSTRTSRNHESDALKRTRNSYFVPIERLQSNSEFITGMMARRYAAISHFGPAAEKAFDLFHESAHRVRVASSMLIEMAGDDGNDRDLQRQLRADIWAGMGRATTGDEIGSKIEEAVALFEGFCRPALERKPTSPSV